MCLMRQIDYLGKWWGGLALEISSFAGPSEMARADRRVPFGAKKTQDFQRQPPHHATTSPRNLHC